MSICKTGLSDQFCLSVPRDIAQMGDLVGLLLLHTTYLKVAEAALPHAISYCSLMIIPRDRIRQINKLDVERVVCKCSSDLDDHMVSFSFEPARIIAGF